MSIAVVHAASMASLARVGNVGGTAYATVNPANGLIWTFAAADQSQVVANYDWAYTPAGGTPASPILNTLSPTITFTGADGSTKTVTLTLNGVAQPPITVTLKSGVAPLMVEQQSVGNGEDLEVDTSDLFDPGEHTVDEVKTYVEAHPDEIEEIYDAEIDGKNRTTLVTWLEENIPYDPGEYTVDEVVTYVEENPDQLLDILAAEVAGKNRATLVSQLEAMREA